MTVIDLDADSRIAQVPAAPQRYRFSYIWIPLLCFGVLAFMAYVPPLPGEPVGFPWQAPGVLVAAHVDLVKVTTSGTDGDVVLVVTRAGGITERSAAYGDVELEGETAVTSVAVAVVPAPGQRAVCSIEVNGVPQDVAWSDEGSGVALCRWHA